MYVYVILIFSSVENHCGAYRSFFHHDLKTSKRQMNNLQVQIELADGSTNQPEELKFAVWYERKNEGRQLTSLL